MYKKEYMGYYTRDGMIDVCVIVSPRTSKEMRKVWKGLTRLEKLYMSFCLDDFTGDYKIHSLDRILGYNRNKIREELKKEQTERVKNGTYCKRNYD